jgi:hypothetical protein
MKRQEFVRKASRRWLGAALGFAATTTILQTFGCSGSGADPAPGTAPAPASTVEAAKPTCVANGGTLTFSTRSSGVVAATPETAAGPLYLNATSTVDPASGAASTRWTVSAGGTPVVSKMFEVRGASTTYVITLEPGAAGSHSATVVNDGQTVTGNVDGHALVPVRLDAPPASGGLRLADGTEVPTAELPGDLQQPLFGLLDKARADASAVCPGNSVSSPTSNLLASLAYAYASASALPASVAALGSRPSTVASVTISATGATGVPSIELASGQNNLAEYNTPDCITCEQQCVGNSFLALITLDTSQFFCGPTCFVPSPFSKTCIEKVCPEVGLGTCDGDQTCCGSGCCGANEACGDSTNGICCPASNPVACGFAGGNGALCFPAGSTCCSADLTFACPAGQSCTTTSTGPGCCPNSHVAADGACCQNAPCGGSCCDQGTCVGGTTCCSGPVTPGGQCCSFGESVCNGACCGGTCTSNGTCCATGTGSTACGSACCGPTQVCLDASTSTCGSPPQPVIEIINPGNGAILDTSGPNAPTAQLTQFTEVDVVGLGFQPGTMNWSTAASPSLAANQIGTSTVGSNGVSADFVLPTGASGGPFEIIGWQTVNGTTEQAMLLYDLAGTQ